VSEPAFKREGKAIISVKLLTIIYTSKLFSALKRSITGVGAWRDIYRWVEQPEHEDGSHTDKTY